MKATAVRDLLLANRPIIPMHGAKNGFHQWITVRLGVSSAIRRPTRLQVKGFIESRRASDVSPSGGAPWSNCVRPGNNSAGYWRENEMRVVSWRVANSKAS